MKKIIALLLICAVTSRTLKSVVEAGLEDFPKGIFGLYPSNTRMWSYYQCNGHIKFGKVKYQPSFFDKTDEHQLKNVSCKAKIKVVCTMPGDTSHVAESYLEKSIQVEPAAFRDYGEM